MVSQFVRIEKCNEKITQVPYKHSSYRESHAGDDDFVGESLDVHESVFFVCCVFTSISHGGKCSFCNRT